MQGGPPCASFPSTSEGPSSCLSHESFSPGNIGTRLVQPVHLRFLPTRASRGSDEHREPQTARRGSKGAGARRTNLVSGHCCRTARLRDGHERPHSPPRAPKRTRRRGARVHSPQWAPRDSHQIRILRQPWELNLSRKLTRIRMFSATRDPAPHCPPFSLSPEPGGAGCKTQPCQFSWKATHAHEASPRR